MNQLFIKEKKTINISTASAKPARNPDVFTIYCYTLCLEFEMFCSILYFVNDLLVSDLLNNCGTTQTAKNSTSPQVSWI